MSTEPNDTNEQSLPETTTPIEPAVDAVTPVTDAPADDFQDFDEAPVVPDLGRTSEIPAESLQAEAPATDPTPEVPSFAVNYEPATKVKVTRPLFMGGREKLARMRFEPFEYMASVGMDHDEYVTASNTHEALLTDLAENARDPKVQDYLFTLANAGLARMGRGEFEDALDRDGADWDNVVNAGSVQLGVSRIKFSDITNGEKLSGAAAVQRVRSLTGTGTTMRIPLWHSGLWVDMRAPTTVDLLELQQRIAHEKVSLGRTTGGLIFSHASIYMTNHLVDFALQHVERATYNYNEIDELKSKIKHPDYLSLVHGLMSAIWPDGYPYSQPCMTNPGKCTHVIEDSIAIPRMAFADRFRLTLKQRDHMLRRLSKFTDLELNAYQAEFAHLKHRTIKLNDTLSMDLRIPDLQTSIQLGVSWIDQIVSRAERALGPGVPQQQREEYMVNQARVSSLVQYLHYVERLTLIDEKGDQGLIEDPKDIAETLAGLTSDKTTYENFYVGVRAFIEESTITVFGVPKVPCPVCSKTDAEKVAAEMKQGRYPYILPLDIVQVFFTLRDQRLTRMYRQEM